MGRDPGGREAVQADPRQLPEVHRGDAQERRLYQWLQHNFDTTHPIYTPERANKLVLAFGDRWQSECFPKSIHARMKISVPSFLFPPSIRSKTGIH